MPTEAGHPTAPPPGGQPAPQRGQPAPPTQAKGGAAPIQIQWDDLNTRRVDQRLKEQAALERNRRQAAMDPLAAGTSALAAEDAAAGRSAPSDGSRQRRGILSHPAVTAGLFGLLGGVLAWSAWLGMAAVQHDPKAEAVAPMRTVSTYLDRARRGQMDSSAAMEGIQNLRDAYGSNPYFAIATDPKLSDDEKTAKLAEVDRAQWTRRFVTDVLTYGLAGMLIAACLSAAEPLLAGNRMGALINGLVGAAAGLAGGIVVSLFAQRLYNLIAPNAPDLSDTVDLHRVLGYAVKWGLLGLFVTIGPGLVMRNGKKFAIGLVGGIVGGLAGGAAYDPIFINYNASVSRLVALVLIGVVAGLFTGLVEHAARTGWLKVTAGLIAGKQFILYRNPTFIGSGPECPIYLFKDPAVGRRHAAVHAVPGGFEVENLPIGADTLVNGRPVTRARLRNGDELQVGATRFRFQEKVKG